jgi:hypothetical protein
MNFIPALRLGDFNIAGGKMLAPQRLGYSIQVGSLLLGCTQYFLPMTFPKATNKGVAIISAGIRILLAQSATYSASADGSMSGSMVGASRYFGGNSCNSPHSLLDSIFKKLVFPVGKKHHSTDCCFNNVSDFSNDNATTVVVVSEKTVSSKYLIFVYLL